MKNEIIQKLNEGKNTETISQELNTSQYKIREQIKKHNIKRRNKLNLTETGGATLSITADAVTRIKQINNIEDNIYFSYNIRENGDLVIQFFSDKAFIKQETKEEK